LQIVLFLPGLGCTRVLFTVHGKARACYITFLL
jgi:hypothetical protein